VTGSESAPVAWRKSSFSGNNGGDCVEVAFAEEGVLLRHSRNPRGPVLSFTQAEWLAFLTGARSGEFDPPGGAGH
jgi:Domain of unknown function (DUF397)